MATLIFDFCSEKPYMYSNALNGFDFDIIPSENITAPYIQTVRKLYPEYADEL